MRPSDEDDKATDESKDGRLVLTKIEIVREC
jgi:hypothetical protein